MDVKSYKITVSDEDTGKGATFFFDLAIIMPLKKATLKLCTDTECRILVGNEYISSQENKELYDITELCEENDYFALSFDVAPRALEAEILLEFAGGVEQKVVTGKEWTYGSFTLESRDLQDKAKYFFETVPKMDKPVKVLPA